MMDLLVLVPEWFTPQEWREKEQELRIPLGAESYQSDEDFKWWAETVMKSWDCFRVEWLDSRHATCYCKHTAKIGIVYTEDPLLFLEEHPDLALQWNREYELYEIVKPQD